MPHFNRRKIASTSSFFLPDFRKISAARIKYFLQGPCELQTQSLSFHIRLFALQVLHQHTRRKSVREQQKAGFPHYHGFVLSDVF
jgi:hypothetical protein